MATTQHLAMTAAEIAEKPYLSSNIAWMACHFSPHDKGLCNLPRMLPEGCVLILDDSIPISGHDFGMISQQLNSCVQNLGCCGLLLDFQRTGSMETAALVRHLSQAVVCPVTVSENYAANLTCGVCLPPVPPSVPLETYISKWNGREIWLELGLDGEQILLTENGSTVTPMPRFTCHKTGHRERNLHCHYSMEECEEGIRFTLWRTREDLEEMIAEAEHLGVTTTVGLWQELSSFIP